MKVDGYKEKSVVNLNMWIMLRECCSLMLLRSWYWRAGLSSSLCWRETDEGWLFWGWFSVKNTFFRHLGQALTRRKLLMMSWFLHAVVRPVKQDKSALWEKDDTGHDWICLKPASVESCVFSWECLPTAWLNSLPAFCATFNYSEVTIRESCIYKAFFPFYLTLFFVLFYFTKRIHMTLTCVNQQTRP